MLDFFDRTQDVLRLFARVTELAYDSHSVVTMRFMGMSGIWPVPQSENSRMLQEKLPAFTEAMMAGTLATMSGTAPEKAMQAAIAPLSKEASANRKRLALRAGD